MSKGWKIILLILFIVYIVSPVDAVPGPIDDAILLLCAVGGGALGIGKNSD